MAPVVLALALTVCQEKAGSIVEPTQAPASGATLHVQPASIFFIGHSSPCHLVFPDGAFLMWDTTVSLDERSGAGRLHELVTTIRSETMGTVVAVETVGADYIVQQLGNNRIDAGGSLTVRRHTILGTCVPEDFTRHRFSIGVVARVIDDAGRIHEFAAGPAATGPARP
jgi:hypothetical protein